LYRTSKKLWSLQQQLVQFCKRVITNAATVDVLVQSPSCQASCDEIQDEVDDRQRSGQSPSHTESHGDDLLSLSKEKKKLPQRPQRAMKPAESSVTVHKLLKE